MSASRGAKGAKIDQNSDLGTDVDDDHLRDWWSQRWRRDTIVVFEVLQWVDYGMSRGKGDRTRRRN